LQRDPRTILHICETCGHKGAKFASGEQTDGARLLAAVERRIAALDEPLQIRVNRVSCMANCEQGCTAALSTPGKWSYIVGRLTAAEADALVDYAAIYAASKSGVVMPSKRPPELKDVVIARLPAHPDDLPANETTANQVNL